MTLTRDEFNRQCIRFVRLCHLYDETWCMARADGRPLDMDSIERALEHERDTELMLTRSAPSKAPNSDHVYSYEYTVIYSDSYEVPVMYFSASDQNGSHLAPDELITPQTEDLAKVINQVEHPLLQRPFFMIHPCRTRDFMEAHLKHTSANYLVCWLSTVGTLINLQLSQRMGLSLTNSEDATDHN